MARLHSTPNGTGKGVPQVKFRTPYTHDRAVSALFATNNTEDDMTSQADAAEADINVIMSRYSKTGQLPQVIQPGQYGDFSQVTDYRDAVDLVRRSEELFHQVPAETRKKFDNDPAKFLEFAQNSDNIDKMVEYGLAEKRQAPPEKGDAKATEPTSVGSPPLDLAKGKSDEKTVTK